MAYHTVMGCKPFTSCDRAKYRIKIEDNRRKRKGEPK